MTYMPTDFPTWYAAVEVGNEDKAAKRWAGIAKVITSQKKDEVEALIRFAMKTKQEPDQAVVKQLVDNIRSADPDFDPSVAGREMQVLTASALVAGFMQSDLGALALTTAHLDGGRNPELPMELFKLAENAVRTKSQASRARKQLKPVAVSEVTWVHSDEQTAAMDSTARAKALRDAVSEAIADTVENINNTLQELEQAREITDEELQMLWWLIGGHLSCGTPIDEIDAAMKPLAIGHELAARTVSRPGPIGIPALLSKSGLRRQTKVKVVDAVNAMDDAWSNSAISGLAVSPVTHPIHDAIRRRTETGAGPDWIRNWSAVSEIADDHALSELRLSELFYRERLLLTVSA